MTAPSTLDRLLQAQLDQFRRDGVYKRLNHLESPQAARVRMEGRGEVIILSSNNYLGLSADPEVMEAALREQRLELDQGSAFLGTIGNNAPFLGLLGTVLGVVKAFQELSTNSGSAMGSVLSGIAEALIATALGIAVALPAVVAYNTFTKRANETEDNVRALTSLVLAHRKSVRFGAEALGGMTAD